MHCILGRPEQFTIYRMGPLGVSRRFENKMTSETEKGNLTYFLSQSVSDHIDYLLTLESPVSINNLFMVPCRQNTELMEVFEFPTRMASQGPPGP